MSGQRKDKHVFFPTRLPAYMHSLTSTSCHLSWLSCSLFLCTAFVTGADGEDMCSVSRLGEQAAYLTPIVRVHSFPDPSISE